MREGGDILTLGRNLTAAMTRITASLPLGIEPTLVADQANIVDHAITDFTSSLWQAILIVLAVSFLALGVRAGAVVAIAIPLTLAIVFPVMEAAAVYAYGALAFAMLSGTLVTIAGFVPIGFARSSAGEYTFSIFAVVAIALIASWFVAVIFAPLLGTMLLKPPKAGLAAKPSRVLNAYRRFLGLAIRGRWVTFAVTLGAFALSIAGLGLVPRQFFPPSDRVELLVDFDLPQNASIHATETAIERFEGNLAGDPGIDHFSSYIGRSAPRFYLPLNVQLANPFFGQVVIVANSLAARERLQPQLEKLLAEEFPSVVSRIYPLELGPPVGWPVQYRVLGPDLDKLRDIAMAVAGAIVTSPDARRINYQWMEPQRHLRVKIDQDEARRLGLSSAAVATVLNTAISGSTVTQIRDGIYLVNVVARQAGGQGLSVDTLRTLQLPLPNGRSVPLNQIASFDYTQEYPLVWRRDREPVLTVQADVAPGILPDAVIAEIRPAIDAVAASLPAGYRIELGGIAEESVQSQASVFAVVPFMLLLVLTILMFQLRSFQRLAIVLSVVPLGLIGVVAALLVSGQPLGFVAILGILALVGMIAKNAVILIEQIEAERRAGKEVHEAVVEASSARFRPIMLTASSTVLGLIPIAPTVFWGAMAFAIMGGLLVASLLTLVFLPTLYVTWFERRRTSSPVLAGQPESS